MTSSGDVSNIVLRIVPANTMERNLEFGILPEENRESLDVIHEVGGRRGYGVNFGGRGYSGGGPGGGGGDSTDGVTLDQVGGLEEQVRYLKRAVLFPLANKNALKKWGFTPPKGILFHGSPGTGKTLIAKAIANELSTKLKTKVTFYYRKGADCLDKYFGQSSANLRQIFEVAESTKPSLIFFDEIDGLCPSRQTSHFSSQVYTTVVTTFLGLMDGVKRGEVFIIAATNRLEAVDPAVRRPGRFDKELAFFPPNAEGRKTILKIHTRNWKKNIPSEELFNRLADCTNGFAGAYLENLCKDARDIAVEREMPEVDYTKDVIDVEIKEQDWAKAVKNLGRPKTKSYGSTLFVVPPNPTIRPLVNGFLPALKAKLLHTFPTHGANSDLYSVKSFLIWDNATSVDKFINDCVIPELFSEPELQSVPIYEFSMETILAKYSFLKNASSAALEIIHQVFSIAKPCVLYMPHVNILWRIFEEQKGGEVLLSLILKKIEQTRTVPVCILATATEPALNMPSELRRLFPEHRSFLVRLPNYNERKEFFSSIFFGKAAFRDESESQSGLKKNQMNRIVTNCCEITEGDTVEHLIRLHGELSITVDGASGGKGDTEKQLLDTLNKVMNQYEKTKLM